MAEAQHRRWTGVVVMARAVGVFAARAHGQDFRGSIGGTISDQTGGALPGVTVTITNADTGVAQTLTTDGRGAFQALYLNSGTYTVAAGHYVLRTPTPYVASGFSRTVTHTAG